MGLTKFATPLPAPNIEVDEEPKVALLGCVESKLFCVLFSAVKALKPDGIVVVAKLAPDVVLDAKFAEDPKAFEAVEVPKAFELVEVPKVFEVVGVPKTLELVTVPKALELVAVPKVLELVKLPKVLEVTAVPKEPIAVVGILKELEVIVLVTTWLSELDDPRVLGAVNPNEADLPNPLVAVDDPKVIADCVTFELVIAPNPVFAMLEETVLAGT